MSRPIYMLDTDIASSSLRGRYPTIDARLERLSAADYCISVVTRAEMLHGLLLAPTTHWSHLVVRRFLRKVTTLDWDQHAADAHAELRYAMRIQGTTVDHLDLMIAAHAVSIGCVLVTNNTKHFRRCAPWLSIENWVTES